MITKGVINRLPTLARAVMRWVVGSFKKFSYLIKNINLKVLNAFIYL